MYSHATAPAWELIPLPYVCVSRVKHKRAIDIQVLFSVEPNIGPTRQNHWANKLSNTLGQQTNQGH